MTFQVRGRPQVGCVCLIQAARASTLRPVYEWPDQHSRLLSPLGLCFLTDEITNSFRRFGHLVVDWPHKAESKSYFPPKGERLSARLAHDTNAYSNKHQVELCQESCYPQSWCTLGQHGGVCFSKVTPLGNTDEKMLSFQAGNLIPGCIRASSLGGSCFGKTSDSRGSCSWRCWRNH